VIKRPWLPCCAQSGRQRTLNQNTPPPVLPNNSPHITYSTCRRVGGGPARAADGYYWLLGVRIADGGIKRWAGHRLGTMESGSALVGNPKVPGAAVVSQAARDHGESAFAYVGFNVPRPQGAAPPKN